MGNEGNYELQITNDRAGRGLRPGGPTDFSPWREPWDKSPSSPSNPAPEGRKNSFPDVTLVVMDAVLLEELDEFFLKGYTLMMFFLLMNIFHHRSSV